MLSAKLAELLGVDRGSRIVVEVLEGRRPVLAIPVVDVEDEYMGTSAYMDAGALRRLLREADTITGAYLRVDQQTVPALYRRLKTTPRVAGVALKDAALESFQKTIASAAITSACSRPRANSTPVRTVSGNPITTSTPNQRPSLNRSAPKP